MKLGADRIRQIVLSLRNFSRLDEAHLKPVDLHEGIDSTLLILHNCLKAKPETPAIEIVKAYGPLPLVECYASQINQVFMNLISNAIDALEEAVLQGLISQPTIHIQTETVAQDCVQITIADNGPGIPPAIQAKLFDAFFTTKGLAS